MTLKSAPEHAEVVGAEKLGIKFGTLTMGGLNFFDPVAIDVKQTGHIKLIAGLLNRNSAPGQKKGDQNKSEFTHMYTYSML